MLARMLLNLIGLTVAAEALASHLDGVYRRVSLSNVHTGESPEAENREGLLILTNGHYAMMSQNPNRPVLTRVEQAALNDAEELNYLRAWLDINAHSGRFSAADGKLVWYRDISEDPKEVGTTTTLDYRVEGAQLVLSFSLPNGDRYDWVWQRIEP